MIGQNPFVGIAALPSGLIAGYLYDISGAYTFGYGSVLAVAACLLLMFVRDG